jgi:D-sedoheptulose 7-phosphate isomerase
MEFIKNYFKEVSTIVEKLDFKTIEIIVNNLEKLRSSGGRLFFLGVGGSAGNASHAVNDFRKLCNIECYAPTDNVSELSARTNDEGWETVFSNWLETSKISKKDAVFILSVGGGNKEKKVSTNLVNAIDLAKSKQAQIFAIIGKSDGYAYKNADFCIHVPEVNVLRTTPHSEAFQAVIWHCMVSHPKLQINKTKW